MNKLKPFDPQDLDSSLLRVVTHGDVHFALFPFVDATSNVPEFKSVTHRLGGQEITPDDLRQLAALIGQRGKHMVWSILFSTPWLVRADIATPPEQTRR